MDVLFVLELFALAARKPVLKIKSVLSERGRPA